MTNLCDTCVFAERINENEVLCDHWGIVDYARNCGTYKPFDINIKEYKNDEEGD